MHSTNIESLLAMSQGLFYVLDETKITALMAITVYNQKSFPDEETFGLGGAFTFTRLQALPSHHCLCQWHPLRL